MRDGIIDTYNKMYISHYMMAYRGYVMQVSMHNEVQLGITIDVFAFV